MEKGLGGRPMARLPCARIGLWMLLGITLAFASLLPKGEALAAAPEITIYFVTNRALVGEDALGPKFGNPASDTLSFGAATIRVLPHKSDPSDIDDYRVLEIRTFGSVGQMLQAAGGAAAARSLKPRALVLVHGYNEGLTASVRRAAAIATAGKIDAVPIVFSWPSANNWRKYNRDMRHAKWSGRALGEALTQLSDSGALGSIHVFAHSMGLRVVASAALSGSIRAKRKLDGLIVASPDMSLRNFRNALPSLTRMAKTIMVESYTRDDALFMSGVRASDVSRLGNSTLRQMQRKGIRPSDKVKIVILDELGVRACEGGSHRCSETSPAALKLLRDFLRAP
jgi:esterase/lipase superfamily enzyme